MEANAGQALGVILGGDVERGLALYRAALKREVVPDAPVGLHLQFLEQAGMAEAAGRLRDLGLRHGGDLRSATVGSGPADAAREYEALFGAGIVNSRMVVDYAKALAALGRFAELRAVIDPERLLRVVRIDDPEPATVEALLLELEPAAEPQESVQSVRNMRMLRHFSGVERPAAQGLMAAIRREAERYFRAWRGSPHPLAAQVPEAFELAAWGLIARGDGHTVPHIHPKGWATGVYYPAAPPAGAGGELVIGRPEGAPGGDADWAAAEIRPEPGLLVLMPSYYRHWTVPLGRPGLRTSVAFDLIRADPAPTA